MPITERNDKVTPMARPTPRRGGNVRGSKAWGVVARGALVSGRSSEARRGRCPVASTSSTMARAGPAGDALSGRASPRSSAVISESASSLVARMGSSNHLRDAAGPGGSSTSCAAGGTAPASASSLVAWMGSSSHPRGDMGTDGSSRSCPASRTASAGRASSVSFSASISGFMASLRAAGASRETVSAARSRCSRGDRAGMPANPLRRSGSG